MGVRKSQEQKILELATKYPVLDFSNSVYLGCRKMLTAICSKHGEITKTGAHWNVNGCPKCGYESSAKPNEARVAGFKRAAQAKLERGRAKWAQWLADNPNFQSTVADYAGMETPIRVVCKKHSFEYKTRPATLIKQGSGCRLCGLETLATASNTPEANVRNARLVHGTLYEYPQPVLRVHTKVEIICKEHGSFTQDFHNHLAGAGCPKCSHRVSVQEMEIVDFLKQQGVEVEIQNRTLIAPAELDIWLPEFNTAIEFNGAHWHADDRQRKNTMLTKYGQCREKGVRLISILDFEYSKRRFAVEQVLLAAIRKQATIGARNIELKQISADDARPLLEKYHVAGFHGAQLHLGMYYKTELVGVGSFGRSRFEEDITELVRYATTLHIIGGLAKIVKHAQGVLGFTQLASYCDLRYGTGRSYSNAGFALASVTPPDYWWFKKNLHFTRYQTQKHKLAVHPCFAEFYSHEKTERQICEDAGFRKVTGVGHQKWVWSSNN